jgi:hypothetical protein
MIRQHLIASYPNLLSPSRTTIAKIIKRGLSMSYRKVDKRCIPAFTKLHADVLYESAKSLITLS